MNIIEEIKNGRKSLIGADLMGADLCRANLWGAKKEALGVHQMNQTMENLLFYTLMSEAMESNYKKAFKLKCKGLLNCNG